MFLNRLWADWQKYLHFYLTGSVMVTIESRWYSAETHCEQGPGCLGSKAHFCLIGMQFQTFLITYDMAQPSSTSKHFAKHFEN